MITLLTCAMLAAVDGDTVRCQPSGQLLRILGDGAPYVSGVDAPEVGHRADCPAEHERGVAASRRLAQLIETPGLVIEDSGETDRWERPLVTLRLPDGQTAGQILINEGLAVEWTPGYRANWCGERE